MEYYSHIHSKYTGIKGFLTVYNDALRYRYMITKEALRRMKILLFWEKHGLEAVLDAFQVKRRTLFSWKKMFNEGGKKPEALNPKKRTPKTRRKRTWSWLVIAELKRLREEHPNLGKEKAYPLLERFCKEHSISCPKPKTIGRLIKDLGGLRTFPQKIRHDGKVVPMKRRKALRKPKGFVPAYPGHLVGLDTVEEHIQGARRYVITFEDIFTRFSFAWATNSHASKAAQEFFLLCLKVFPYPIAFVLTDNGSEFMKHFEEELKHLHLTHWHTYPRTPKMNAHMERFNRTLQEEFLNWHKGSLVYVDTFNRKLVDWLVWYNTDRVHHAFQNKLSPVQFMLSLQPHQLPQECKVGWPHTISIFF
jgi:transposase InsO family protein